MTDPQRWRVRGERIVYDNPWVQVAIVDVQPPDMDLAIHGAQ